MNEVLRGRTKEGMHGPGGSPQVGQTAGSQPPAPARRRAGPPCVAMVVSRPTPRSRGLPAAPHGRSHCPRPCASQPHKARTPRPCAPRLRGSTGPVLAGRRGLAAEARAAHVADDSGPSSPAQPARPVPARARPHLGGRHGGAAAAAARLVRSSLTPRPLGG
jgi:hypothetical protein